MAILYHSSFFFKSLLQTSASQHFLFAGPSEKTSFVKCTGRDLESQMGLLTATGDWSRDSSCPRPYPAALRSEDVHISWAHSGKSLARPSGGFCRERTCDRHCDFPPFSLKTEPRFYSGKQLTQLKSTIPSFPICQVWPCD